MKVAIFLDYTVPINRREGTLNYLGYLMDALLLENDQIMLEVWLYSSNNEVFRREFSDILKKYPTRIQVFSERDFDEYEKLEIKHYIYYLLYRIFHLFSRVLRLKRLEKKLGVRAAIQYSLHIQKKKNLTVLFNNFSKADLAYVPIVILEAAIGVKVPCVVQIHDLFTLPLEELFNNEFRPRNSITRHNEYLVSQVTKYAKHNSVFISSTEYTKNTQILKYVHSVSEKQCKVVPFPAMYTHFDMNSVIPKEEFLKKYGISTKYIAFPSQNRPNKNIILLLKALKIVNDETANIKLVTTGKMDACNSTAEFIRGKSDLVVELSDLSMRDLFCLYYYSEMVVCPNIIEGLGISAQCLEALSIGKPVIHAKSMGVSESLKNVGLNYDTAKLNWVELDDYRGLANKITYVLNNQEEVVRNQRNVYEAYSKLTWEDVAKEYLCIFEECLKGKNR